ncbi:MAG: formylglycine-generating enzyme family protein [Myxococcota bacterium]|nr:formylglycine-generating enzyme family protein [Myxococcota bacterium]
MMFFWCLLFGSVSWGADVRLAILEYRAPSLRKEALMILNEELRLGVQDGIDAGSVDVVSKEQTEQAIRVMQLPPRCSTGGCELDIGRNMGVDYLVSPTVINMGSLFVLRVTLYDLQRGAILSSESKNCGTEKDLFVVNRKLTTTTIRSGFALLKPSASMAETLPEEPVVAPVEDTDIIIEEIEISKQVEVALKVGVKAVYIPAGTFQMGCDTERASQCGQDEIPRHDVEISRDIYMLKSEVTQGLYAKVVSKRPSQFLRCGDSCPTERVSWYDAVRFANALSEKEGFESCYDIDGRRVLWNEECMGWRLPTEAEWEYAAYGGESFLYGGSDSVDENGWSESNAQRRTHPVCEKKQNAYGLCDMSGNVWEWVWDAYVADGYASRAGEMVVDPKQSQGNLRVLRGGCWGNKGHRNRVTSRLRYGPQQRNWAVGFRLVRYK